GGIVCDAADNCLLTYTFNFCICSITRAEILVAVTGLQLAWDVEYRKVVWQSNLKIAILILHGVGEVT
ncbi:hypothetical protein LINPERPRIM_LOCUS28751, partial [Linum perenne]